MVRWVVGGGGSTKRKRRGFAGHGFNGLRLGQR